MCQDSLEMADLSAKANFKSTVVIMQSVGWCDKKRRSQRPIYGDFQDNKQVRLEKHLEDCGKVNVSTRSVF